ncbi:glycosyl hydrolase family 43 [Isoptericola jiangsuensis]|uniref:Glycosyl hydrolase family 43 n=1 Tax=Isoptericola jiangsuensis TaxID=548579 RepID=A0A2A9ESI1_9MICO|nr:glycoside hydrolase family 43 protein [Isoptericola jiangsuensis]PFG41491.1 glycosyl hydrolase family 43 [Isoptericola jiangsuensis]
MTVGRPAALVAAVLLVAACGAPDGGGDAAPSPDVPRPQPVIDRDFPDPDVVATDDGYVAFATNDHTSNVQVATSPDLRTWEHRGDALPDLPPWIIPGLTWAPEVAATDDGYRLYFTARDRDTGLQCIGVAAAAGPLDTFEVVGGEMLVCPVDQGGAIDADVFRDGEQTYLVWKNDGNCCGHDTWIQAAPLADDGLSLDGEPFRLFKQDLPWEGDLVEAPTLLERDGTYHALYSASFYGDDTYAVGHATAPALTGPWTKDPEPLLSTGSTGGLYRGPGGQDVVGTPDGDVLVFHAWDGAYIARETYTLPLDWTAAGPQVRRPAGTVPPGP